MPVDSAGSRVQHGARALHVALPATGKEAALLAAARLYRTSEFYFAQALSGLPEAALTRRVGLANSIVWTAGHVTVGRLRILKELGEQREIPWTDLFGKGANENSRSIFPPIASVVEQWNAAAPRLYARLDSLSDSELTRPVRFALPGGEAILGTMIDFFAFHEAYHIGQMALLRKALAIAPQRRTADRLLAEAG